MSELKENQSGGQSDRQGQDKLVDAKKSDAASVNQRDTERIADADKASAPSYEVDSGNAPLSTQGSKEETEENLGGTTNLTLEQLKKEGDPAGEE